MAELEAPRQRAPRDPAAPLAGARVVVGVAGGIAAYKAAELVRLLDKAGARVDVAMTARAQEFVGAMTFQALTRRPVFTESVRPHRGGDDRPHPLADAADLVVIAPATANAMARLAAGMADDAVTAIALATTRAGAARAGDEREHVGAPAHAGERAPARRRRALSRRRPRRRLPGVPVDRPGPARRAGRHRRGRRVRARRRRTSPASASSSRPGRRTRRSIRRASSATAAPARWASRSPPPRAGAAPTSRCCSGPSTVAAAGRRDHRRRRDRRRSSSARSPTPRAAPTRS